MRRQHPAVESAINSLEHRGLDRVRTHGTEGFARMVALSVLAGNLHRLGRLLRQQEQDVETTRRHGRLIGGGVAHTSAFEPAPGRRERRLGRVKIGAGPSPRLAGIFLDEIGLQLARKVWCQESSDRGVF